MIHKTKHQCLLTGCSGCETCTNNLRYTVTLGYLNLPSIYSSSLQIAKEKAKKKYGKLVSVELDD